MAENRYFWKQDRWNGGLSEDSRIGKDGALRYMIGADTRTDSGNLSVVFKPTLHSGTAISKLIKWIEINPSNGDTYLYGGDTIYKESGGVYSTGRTIASGAANGQGLCHFNGKLYYRTGNTLGFHDYSIGWTDSWQTGLSVETDFSPMCRFKNLLLVAHGRHIGTVDDVGFWTAQRITLPPGYKARSIFRAGSFAVILAIYGDSVFASEEGYMFLWDGTRETYNQAIPLDGNPHAGFSNKNKIMILAGQEPVIQESQGAAADFAYSIPNVGLGQTAEIYPGAIDAWRSLVYFGISGGTSLTVMRALYGWGSRKTGFETSLTPEYPPSHGGLSGSTVKITAVKRVGTTLRFAWVNGSTYGVDQIDTTQYVNEAVVRTLAFDNRSAHEKNAYRLMVELAGALKSGEYVTASISPDPYDDPNFANIETDGATKTQKTQGMRILELPLMVNSNPIKSRDLHVELKFGGSGTTRPKPKRIWVAITESNDQL